MKRRLTGFTLLEMMIVVAIIGILSTLGVVSIVSMTRLGRINGAAGALTRALVDGRLRAMTQRCPHLVQINGSRFVPTASPASDARAPRTRGSVAVIRKASCDTLAPVMSFEAGVNPDGSDRDRVLTTTILGDETIDLRGVRIFLTSPSATLASNELTTQALTVAYDALGVRTFSVHTGGGSSFTTATTADLTLVIVSPVDDASAASSATVSIPTSGVAFRL